MLVKEMKFKINPRVDAFFSEIGQSNDFCLYGKRYGTWLTAIMTMNLHPLLDNKLFLYFL